MSDDIEPNKIERYETTPWLLATADDFLIVDVEAPIAGNSSANCNDLSDLYAAAARVATESNDPTGAATIRVYDMLSALAGMYFKSQEKNEPSGPMAVFEDRRTAIPSDFAGHIEILETIGTRAANPVLRARICDVCWLLDQKRGTQALAAISAYTEIVHLVMDGKLKLRLAEIDGSLDHDIRDLLRRALFIGRTVGWEKSQTLAARDLVDKLRNQALTNGALMPVRWFSELALHFGVADPKDIGSSLERALTDAPESNRAFHAKELWRLAARAYHFARLDDDKNRCLAEAAEALVAESEANKGSAMLSSHFLSNAIAQLRNIPGKKGRRMELRHRLIDIQAGITEELSSFTQELDLQEIAEGAERAVGRATLLENLFAFANLNRSPDLKTLSDEAIDSIKNHPLSSLFGGSHHDREGKVIHRSQGAGFGDSENNSAIQRQIAQAETIRRKVVASGQIEAARNFILNKHSISDETIATLLKYSPFVPHDTINTFARGFTRFFQGDLISATYILTPLLENSLRHILKSCGYEVTTFDDATQTQEDRTISSLFGQMREELNSVLTPEITSDIERVFLMKPGPYIRHSVAHGLMDDGDPYGADSVYACWLIFRLCLLPLMRHYQWLQANLEGSELCMSQS